MAVQSKGKWQRQSAPQSSSGRGRSRRDPALNDSAAAQVMLTHYYLGCFCCFNVNNTSPTPQLFSLPEATWKKFTGPSPLSSLSLPEIIFPLYNWQNRVCFHAGNKSINSWFQYGQHHYKPPIAQGPRAARKGICQERWEHQPWITASHSTSLIDAFLPSPEKFSALFRAVEGCCLPHKMRSKPSRNAAEHLCSYEIILGLLIINPQKNGHCQLLIAEEGVRHILPVN